MEKYKKERDDFGTGYEYGMVHNLDRDVDSLERLLKEAK